MALETRHESKSIIYDLILRVDSFKSTFYIAQAIYHKTIWIFVKREQVILVCGVTMEGAFRLSFVTGSSRILNLDISKFKLMISIHFLICRIKPFD
jgi:hypothetical protein